MTGCAVLVNGNEELGTPTSAELIRESARGCVATLVLKRSADDAGAVTTARTGISRYEVVVEG